MAKSNELAVVVAEVCFYGVPSSGFGWLATANIRGATRRLGDADPRPGSLTEALFSSIDALERLFRSEGLRAAIQNGAVKLFAPGGELVATCALSRPPYWGELKWSPAAPGAVITVGQVLDASYPDARPLVKDELDQAAAKPGAKRYKNALGFDEVVVY